MVSEVEGKLGNVSGKRREESVFRIRRLCFRLEVVKVRFER